MNKKWRKAIAVVLSLVMVAGAFAGDFAIGKKNVEAAPSGEPIKVDINKDENRALAESETFTVWKIGNAVTHTTTIDEVTFTLSNGGTTGGTIKGACSKGILREGDTTSPRLTCDGALIDFGDDEVKSGAIKLEISGLTAGTHTVKTWHSFFDAVVGSSMTLYINGEEIQKIDSISRAYTDDDAFITYNEVEVKEGETVTVLIKANGDGEYDSAVLNAFAIDDVNPVASIKNPYPAVGETHFQPKDGLSWTEADGAVSHDVYLGTDYDAVKNATTESEEFLGNQTATSCAVEAMNLTHTKTYYWRVDEHTEKGVFQGEVMSFEVAHLAFPTAEGYGRFAKGGRFGRVIEVTNLNDSGPGSLRQAVEVEKGPRIVVFRVGGVIKLESRLKVPADGGNVYIAGQTAPGDGITLTHHAFGIYYAEDVIIRHVRLRVGDTNGVSTDGMGMAGANHSIIDHCSIAWTTDEGASSRYADNITFQYNLIAEALNNSVHYNGDNREETERHSFAGSISGDIGSFHHNLLVNCTGRNWSLAGGMEQDGVTYAGKLDVRNNVVYNFRNRTTDGGVKRINFVNNYYKKGAVSNDMKIFTIDGNELNTNDMQMAYLSGNMLVDKAGKVILAANQDAWESGRAASAGKNSTTADVRSDEPFFPSYVETQTAEDAYTTVLASAGATVPKRDYLDTRYVKETTEGSYTFTGSKDGLKGIIDSQDDVGGYPDSSKFSGGTRILKDDDHDGMPNNWEEAYGLNPNDAEDRNGLNLSADGYTNLEMYLNELAGDEVVYADDKEVTVSFDDEYYEDIEIVVPSVEPTATPEASPEASEETGTSKEPEASEAAEASKEPEASEETEASKEPVTSEEASASKEPVTSEEVETSQAPMTSEETSESKEPVASEGTTSEIPQVSEKPVVSEGIPTASKVPEKVVTTEAITNEDGTVTNKVTEKEVTSDGKVIDKVSETTTKSDGTVVEKVKEVVTKTDGSTETTTSITITDSDGSVETETQITTKDKDGLLHSILEKLIQIAEDIYNKIIQKEKELADGSTVVKQIIEKSEAIEDGVVSKSAVIVDEKKDSQGNSKEKYEYSDRVFPYEVEWNIQIVAPTKEESQKFTASGVRNYVVYDITPMVQNKPIEMNEGKVKVTLACGSDWKGKDIRVYDMEKGRWMDSTVNGEYVTFEAEHFSKYAIAEIGEAESVMLGDVNQDGVVDLADAQMALKGALKIIELKDKELKAADVDGCGVVELSDAQMILKYALKIINSWE